MGFLTFSLSSFRTLFASLSLNGISTSNSLNIKKFMDGGFRMVHYDDDGLRIYQERVQVAFIVEFYCRRSNIRNRFNSLFNIRNLAQT